MNKKGFTLVELLAVIALLAILMGIAVPNVISTINNHKKDTFLMDAKRMVSKAEYLISSSKTDRDAVQNGTPRIYTFEELNEDLEYQTDADGGEYQEASVTVTYDTTNQEYKFCIYVVGSKRKIASNTNTCVDSSLLTGIDVVKEN